ncbi:MAG: sulfite exporter TauE/SafE family protein [Prevotellaceae bacterium]|jgi:uncharacterized membrane protein YfcA|nr:sulfite exporter TauE/SafE family protein [Prevotellaceae bacterium]
MGIELFSLILLGGAACAGMLGALTGLGGGVVIIPLLTLGFGVDMRFAIGTALVTSIATSSGAASAYIRDGITNVRIGIFLEIATASGAVAGALIAMYMPTNIIAVIFACVLIFSAIMTVRKKSGQAVSAGDAESRLAEKLKLNGSYFNPETKKTEHYTVRHVVGGYSLMTFAGVLSGLLGIGSGALKVLSMDMVMKIPFRVSTTTSNFMVGVTAAASAVIYLQRGYIDPGLAMPVVAGVLAGAFLGSKILMRTNVKTLRWIFSALIFFLALQMMYNGITGKL